MDDIGVGILQYWEQLLFFLGALVVAVRLQSEVSALRKDVDLLEQETKVQANSCLLYTSPSPRDT